MLNCIEKTDEKVDEKVDESDLAEIAKFIAAGYTNGLLNGPDKNISWTFQIEVRHGQKYGQTYE